MRRSARKAAVALAAALLMVSCTAQPLTVTPVPTTVRIVTSDTCAPLVERLVRAYAEEAPWVTFQVEVFNRATAESRLREGAADLAVLPGAEPADLWSFPLGTDGLAIVVHPDVPVGDLSLAQLREILRGRVGEWPDGTPIQVVTREEGSAARAILDEVVMGGGDVTPTAILVPDARWMLKTVAETTGAIGYLSQARADERVRVLTVEGVSPAQLPSYPLRYPLLLVARSEPTGEARAFAQWVVGPEGQRWVLERFGPPP